MGRHFFGRWLAHLLACQGLLERLAPDVMAKLKNSNTESSDG